MQRPDWIPTTATPLQQHSPGNGAEMSIDLELLVNLIKQVGTMSAITLGLAISAVVILFILWVKIDKK